MSQNIVVAYDGSEGAGRALDFAVEKAKAQGGNIVIAYVLEWSPYTFLTPTELEERHGRRKEELTRAEEHIAPVVKAASDKGVSAISVIKYGKPAEILEEIATSNDASQIVLGRSGDSSLSNRLFGSVASSLAQSASVPVTIVP